MIQFANRVHPQLDLMIHAKVHFMRSIVVMGYLVKTNLFHSAFHVILNIIVALLLVHVRLVLVLSLQLMNISNPIESVDLLVIAKDF